MHLGAALLARTISLGWVLRLPTSRTLKISAEGERGFSNMLGHLFERYRSRQHLAGELI